MNPYVQSVYVTMINNQIKLKTLVLVLISQINQQIWI